MKYKRDMVSIFMCGVFILSLLMDSFMIVMENRISPMQHISAKQSLGSSYALIWGCLIILVLLVLWKDKSEKKNFITGIWASICLGGCIFFAGLATNNLMVGHTSTYRVTFGVGIYLIMIASYSIIVKCNEFINKSWKKKLSTFLGIFIIVFLVASGWLNKMSIMTEYFTRQDKFYQVFWEHLNISLLVVITSIIIGLPVGYLCYRYKFLDMVISGILNVVRSIPAIALIILMVGPLSLLKEIPILNSIGISSFGATPVFCALFLYSIFQVINSLRGALMTIDRDYIKAAKAMGMTNIMIMFKVQIPLVLPVLVSGIRVAMISTFTGASLGTMVGFGGLGTFIRMGDSSAIALDLILLGAIPIMIMIFITDLVFSRLSRWVKMRMTGVEYDNRYELTN